MVLCVGVLLRLRLCVGALGLAFALLWRCSAVAVGFAFGCVWLLRLRCGTLDSGAKSSN